MQLAARFHEFVAHFVFPGDSTARKNYEITHNAVWDFTAETGFLKIQQAS
jgi:hypothetical protein